MKGVLDTSVLIAAESGRRLAEDRLPDESAITVITLAELNAGALVADDVETRASRMATVQAMADVEVLPVDEAAALVWARMRVHLAAAGRRVNVNDLWIAAIAVSRDLTVFTQDDDFDAIEGVAGLDVVKV